MKRTLILLTSACVFASLGCAPDATEGNDDFNTSESALETRSSIALGGDTIGYKTDGRDDDDGFGDYADPTGNGRGVDIDAMEASLRADLENNVVGFAYTISKDGVGVRADGWGDARRGTDGNMAMTEHVPINVASVSKTVTAVATLQLLEKNGMSVDDLIAPWLPPAWTQGPGVAGLTFRHLLSHRTGWNQMFQAMSETEQASWGNDWNGIAYVVENGATPNAAYSYKNANYAVLRMIIPALWDASGLAPFVIDPLTELNYGWYFVGYLQDTIFEPAGVMDAGCWDLLDDTAAHAYDFTQPLLAGQPYEDTIYHCGGHANLLLSAADLGAFMAHIRYDDAVLSPANRLLMDQSRLGWNAGSNQGEGKVGKYWHGGDWWVGRAYHACVMKFPQNIEATLVINSESPKYQCTVLKDAYNNAL